MLSAAHAISFGKRMSEQSGLNMLRIHQSDTHWYLV
jgi:hypothetical protein